MNRPNAGNEMVYVRSLDPNEKRKNPRQIPRKLLGTAAAKNHKIVEVPDPTIEVKPKRIEPLPTGPDERDLLIAQLEAKLAAMETANKPQVEAIPQSEEAPKRGPGRPPKEKPLA